MTAKSGWARQRCRSRKARIASRWSTIRPGPIALEGEVVDENAHQSEAEQRLSQPMQGLALA
jgi:hypothetical protein